MMYFDILFNDCDDCLLYVNGKAYNDIDYRWVDCIMFLAPLLEEKVTITKRWFDGTRQDYPDTIEVDSYDYRWNEIRIQDVPSHIMKRTLKCKLPDTEILIEPGNNIPDTIRIDAITRGQWFILID